MRNQILQGEGTHSKPKVSSHDRSANRPCPPEETTHSPPDRTLGRRSAPTFPTADIPVQPRVAVGRRARSAAPVPGLPAALAGHAEAAQHAVATARAQAVNLTSRTCATVIPAALAGHAGSRTARRGVPRTYQPAAPHPCLTSRPHRPRGSRTARHVYLNLNVTSCTGARSPTRPRRPPGSRIARH